MPRLPKEILSERMKDSWRIARAAVKKFGGKPSDYIREAMKPEVREALKEDIYEERKDEIAFENFLTDLETTLNEAISRIRKPGWRARCEARRDDVFVEFGSLGGGERGRLGNILRTSEHTTIEIREAVSVYVFSSDQDDAQAARGLIKRIVTFLGDSPVAESLQTLLNDIKMYVVSFGEEVDI